MNCPYCSTPLLSGLTICPRCKYNTALSNGGKEHAQWLKDEQERKNRLEAEIAGQQYGVKWMNFYINWRFPISFVLGFFMLIAYFPFNRGTSEQYPTTLYLFLALDILVYVFRIPVYINMRKRNQLGHSLNVVLLIVETLTVALRQGMRGTYPVASFLLAYC